MERKYVNFESLVYFTLILRDAVTSILAVVAKQERVRLSERTLAGLATAGSRGRIGGRPRVAGSLISAVPARVWQRLPGFGIEQNFRCPITGRGWKGRDDF